MRGLLTILLLLPFSSFAATYYVATTGDDGDDGSVGSPWLTIQKAANVMVAGDTTIVNPGNYGETVTTVNSGTAGNYITFRSSTPQGAQLKAFRVQDRYQWIEGFDIAEGGADANNALVRIEYNGTTVDGSYLMLTNNLIRDTKLAISTNAAFGSNYMTATDVMFTNFQSGDLVFLGADSHNWHTNHDIALTVLSNSVDGFTIYFEETLAEDTGTNYWAPLYAGTGNAGYQGILFVQGSGSLASSNVTIINNVISNIFGNNLNLNGNPGNNLVKGNTFAGMRGRYAFRLNSSSTIIEDNLIYEGGNIIWFTQQEIENIEHPPGGDWYDYQANIMDAQATAGIIATNNILRRNWFENLDNQAGLFTGNNLTQSGMLIQSNVFVGIQAQGGGAMDNLVYGRNTFYRVGFDPANNRTIALALGGTSNNTNQTGLIITNNVFIDCGSHAASTRMSEGGYTIDGATTSSPLATNNFIAGPETTGWENKTGVHAGHNYNSNPLLVNPRHPRGADGLPFTADDGLRPLPSSILALNNLGALEAVTASSTPIARFDAVPPTYNWFDLTGTNYNPDWVLIDPGLRGGNIRGWQTPEALGHIPLTVTFDASTAISGLTGVTNHYGIRWYRWNFGDGATALGVRPTISHTYLTVGEMTVTLWVTNFAGAFASYTNIYRTLEQTNAVDIFHVKLTGNDTTGDGSEPNAWRTIDKAVNTVTAGDYVAVHAGTYNELVDVDLNLASVGSRIAFVSLGAATYGWNIRHPYYTIEGFTINETNLNLTSGPIYLYETADGTWIQNNFFDATDTGSRDDALIYMATPASVIPDDGQLNCKLQNNFALNCRGFGIRLYGANHEVSGNGLVGMHGEADFIRPHGSNHWIHANFYFEPRAEDGGHPDCIQVFGNNGAHAINSLIEGNTFLGGRVGEQTNIAVCQLEQDSSPSDYSYTNGTSMTNIVIRNNLFANLGNGGSVDIDGTKWHNNLFYKVGINAANAMTMVWGGGSGSAYGSEIKNCAFVEGGLAASATSGGWYDRMEGQSITNYSLVADYNYVVGTNGVAKQEAPPDGSTRWKSSGGTPPNTWEDNGVNGGLPLFADVTIYDFRLATNSPLRDAGVTIASFSEDAYGNARPEGGAWDIGPLETVGEAGGGGESPATNRVLTVTGTVRVNNLFIQAP